MRIESTGFYLCQGDGPDFLLQFPDDYEWGRRNPDPADYYVIKNPTPLTEAEIEVELGSLSVPDTVPERAAYWQDRLESGSDIRELSDFAHSIFVPEIRTVYVPFTMQLQNRDRIIYYGRRDEFLDKAAGLILSLGEMARTGGDSVAESYLKRIRNIAGLAIIFVHGYFDGNGSAARAAGGIIYEGTASATRLMYLGSHGSAQKGAFMSARYRADSSDVIEKAASLDVPLDQQEEYWQVAREHFCTPNYQEPLLTSAL